MLPVCTGRGTINIVFLKSNCIVISCNDHTQAESDTNVIHFTELRKMRFEGDFVAYPLAVAVFPVVVCAHSSDRSGDGNLG